MHRDPRVHDGRLDVKGNVLNSDISSFYITNFPESVQADDLWWVCGRLGNMVEAFISKKLSRMGKQFGFVRFSNVRSFDQMINCLCEVWFRTYKMFASSPRFKKKEDTNRLKKKIELKISQNPVYNSQVLSPLNSYASIVKGTHVANASKAHIEEIIDLSYGDFIVEKYNRACLVKARDFHTLPNLCMLCLDEGFEDFDMKYVGGLWVLIEFKSKHAC